MTEQEINEEIQKVIEKGPRPIKKEYRYDRFEDGAVVGGKKKGHLPPMGWNSWNAFSTGNTEDLTRAMADSIIRLGLDKLGYQYVVLDDGCYLPERVNGLLVNEPVKFPGGFAALGEYLHARGLKFGMYNDIGARLCSGAYVGTCGHEKDDAKLYAEWGVDFMKVDNCYYLWDNATFSDAENAKYVFAPNIKTIRISGEGFDTTLDAVRDGRLYGQMARKAEGFVTDIGTFDGTGPGPSPVGVRSGELIFLVTVPKDGVYTLSAEYATAHREGQGSWLQVAVSTEPGRLYYDGFVPESEDAETFVRNCITELPLKAGNNEIRLMNHRRQENTLCSYASFLEALNEAKPGHDIILSICEWGKTQPQNWGYKVGDTWRILNDITFRCGSDGNPGFGAWKDPYTPSVTSQYNKAVVMDEFAGLTKGWNDPDMLMIGMDGLTETMNRTHMAMWCMLNAPLMLGLDLRRVQKGDKLYRIIANEELIALNQDALGVQAKRIYSSFPGNYKADREYITNIDRVDILAKPLKDGSVALSFINVSEERKCGDFSVTVRDMEEYLTAKLPNAESFLTAKKYLVTDLWSGETVTNENGTFAVKELDACDNVTIRVKPVM